MLIITTAGDPFSDHNVNNVIEDSLVVFGFSVLEASPFISDSPVRSADPLVWSYSSRYCVYLWTNLWKRRSSRQKQVLSKQS